MSYPKKPDFRELVSRVGDLADLKHEQGAKGTEKVIGEVERSIRKALAKLESLRGNATLRAAEPDDLPGIKKLRPAGPRRIWNNLNTADYRERLAGAFLARCAGCTLGAIVEGWSVKEMENFAATIGDQFPPVDYWSRASAPHHVRYLASRCEDYTRSKMNGVPVDDDIAYTMLGLLIVEECGLDFTTADVGRLWLKYVPIAYTAEKAAIASLKKGMSWKLVGDRDNPYRAWIGADIRSDPWGYLAPGWPEKAAELAYRDAFISHRRDGIYGEMFFSAAIAAAFTVNDSMEALEIALTEIPKNCGMANAVKWALKTAPKIKDYKSARNAVDKKFPGMHHVHTLNNACLSIFGLVIGGKNVTRVISQTVAMGMDNDCTAATAGSIVGAVVGKSNIPPHWYKPFGNTVHSYLIGKKTFTISDLLARFESAATQRHQTST